MELNTLYRRMLHFLTLTPRPGTCSAPINRFGIQALEVPSMLSVSVLNNVGQGYAGLSFNQSGGYVPPDTNGAAGPYAGVEIVNQTVALYPKKERTLLLHWLKDLKKGILRVCRPQRPQSRTGNRGFSSLAAEVECLEVRALLNGVPAPAISTSGGTWTPLTNFDPAGGAGTMLLLPDGTVMAQGADVTNAWTKLTPDSSGNYVNGTWSNLASMSTPRLYFGSNVLPSGNVFLVGGEYSGAAGAQNDLNAAEIYNPVQNTWTSINSFPMSHFGDDPTMVLPNGQILVGYLSGAQTFLFDPTTQTWSQTGSKLRGDSSDEETWTLLPDGSVLSYDVFSSASTGVGHAQRYIPSTGTWVDAGTVSVPLSSSGVGYEMGPATLLPDGRVLEIGANGNSAIYTPSMNTWAAGPVLPAGLGADDAPGAELPNGKFIFAADTTLFNGPTKLFEFDPSTNSYADVTPGGALGAQLGGAAFVDRMLVLPNGHVLLTTGAGTLWDYAPNGAPPAAWAPTINNVMQTAPNTYTLTGTQLTGLSEGASYGDDAEMDSNYPIVRLTSGTGVVKYARTSNWTPGVATGGTPETVQFTVPAGFGNGTYQLAVIANGIASTSTSFTVGASSGASKLGFQQAPPANGTAGTALSSAITVAVQDGSGNLVTGDNSTVTLTLSSGTFANGATTVSAQAVKGVATFSGLVINTAGNYKLTATDRPLASVTSGSIAIAPATASQLVFQTVPAPGTVGVVLAPAVTVAVKDAFGNIVTSNAPAVTLSVAAGPGAFSIGSTVSVNAVNGVATFNNLILNSAGTYTFKAVAGSMSVLSPGALTISPVAATHLAILQRPSTGTAGSALTSVKIAVEDASRRIVARNSSVTLTLSSGTFSNGSKSVSVRAVNGVATISGLVINKAGSYALTASDGVSTPVTSANIPITAAAVSQMIFQSIPTTVGTAGIVLPTTKVALEDVYGNVATGNSSTVTLGIATGPAGFAGGSTLSVAAKRGVATFSNLILNTSGKYTLIASDGSLPAPKSGTFTINPAAATQLVLLQAPKTGTAGVALSPVVKVAVEDQFGNLVTAWSNVTLTLSSGTFSNGSTTYIAGVSNGIATFSKLIINAAGSYTLTASDGTTTGTSFAVTINPAAASKLVFQQVPPASGIAVVTLSPATKVAVQDKFGNLIASDNSSSVTLKLGGGTFANGSTAVSATAVNGVASFAGLIINKPSSYTLKATDGTLTAVNSGLITIISPGNPAQIPSPHKVEDGVSEESASNGLDTVNRCGFGLAAWKKG